MRRKVRVQQKSGLAELRCLDLGDWGGPLPASLSLTHPSRTPTFSRTHRRDTTQGPDVSHACVLPFKERLARRRDRAFAQDTRRAKSQTGNTMGRLSTRQNSCTARPGCHTSNRKINSASATSVTYQKHHHWPGATPWAAHH